MTCVPDVLLEGRYLMYWICFEWICHFLFRKSPCGEGVVLVRNFLSKSKLGAELLFKCLIVVL